MTEQPRAIESGYEMQLRPHQAEELFDHEHRLIFSIGGVGSGKSAVAGLIIIDRSSFDVSQRGGLFATTSKQLQQTIIPEVFKWLDLARIDYVYGRQPPEKWKARWKRFGIQTPSPLANHAGVITLDSGLQLVTGSLHSDAFMQFRSFQFGFAIIEEATAGMKKDALSYIIERVRCGIGEEACKAAGHRHQIFVHGNPPDSPDHWIYDYLEKMDPKAYRMISSSSYDNVDAIGSEYIEGLLGTMDRETADLRIHGKLVRNKTGRAYSGFDEVNKHPVRYDPSRTL
ncbi:MAG TPA: hypothetical protein VNM92_13855 [Thermoanaerobaculia bacterium]|nr:hypothetical protein [Thermoanaerobaculia bacterium]